MSQVKQSTEKRVESYEQLLKQFKALIDGESDMIANLSNATALLNQFLQDINWVGFYLWKDNELVLGPFQGRPACVRIGYGQGVCGTAVKTKQSQLVGNVHEFPGHIACDGASRSEIVCPIIVNNNVFGVLDIDSPSFNRFDELDQEYLERFVSLLLQSLPDTHKSEE